MSLAEHSGQPPLIVGAGPVGLAAALLLAQRGRRVRIVEALPKAAAQSKALAVNPRTLDLLEPTGVTARMLELGRPIRGVRFCRVHGSQVRQIGAVRFEGIHPRYPHMLALSQATTERLLGEAFMAAGGVVERATKLVACRSFPTHVEATLERDGVPETVRSQWLLAADGAHSTARKALGVGFPGTTMPHGWHLVDVALETPLENDEGHVFFLDDGSFLFLLPVVGGVQGGEAGSLWRVMSNRPDPLGRLVAARPAGEPVWVSSFGVPHRLASTLNAGSVYFAGDAAHVHSPVGARGMNLGIEDAAVFAMLEGVGGLSRYESLRRPVDASVVRRVELVSNLAAAETMLFRFVRGAVFPLALRVPAVRARLARTVAGLASPMPRVVAGSAGASAGERPGSS